MGHPAHESTSGATAGPTPTSPLMQAVVQDVYGGAEALRLDRIAVPVVGPGDVLIRVNAAGVHVGDWHVMTGRPLLMRIMGFGFSAPKARVRGMDVAGVVAAIGADVTRLRVGDEVYGTCDGSFAEYATARVETLARKPVSLTFEQAAAVPTSACTALQALQDAGEVTVEQRVLIIGASGGVGLFAVQIAKALGAEVTGVCSAAKRELVQSVGADHVIAYTEADIRADGQLYDLVLDMGGNRTLAQLRRLLTPAGTLVLVGGEGGGSLLGAAMVRSLRAVVLSPFVRQRLRMIMASTTAKDLQILTGLIDSGLIGPVVEQTYPLADAAEAVQHLHSGRARGKLVITV